MVEDWKEFIYCKHLIKFANKRDCSIYDIAFNKINSSNLSELEKEVVDSVCSERIRDCGISFGSGLLICKDCLCYKICEKKYKDKAAIIFIDVWENQAPAKRFGIRAIPTQIFFNKEGKEVYRHVGFLSEEAIVAQLKKMGVD